MTDLRRNVSSRPGFALLLSLFALLLIGAATIAGHLVAAQQFRAGHAVGASAAALYAAEAGLSLALVRWDAGVVTGLAPGSSVPLTSGTLETGDRFEVFVTKLGEVSADRSAYYLVSSIGRTRRYPGARRQVGLLVRFPGRSPPCSSEQPAASQDTISPDMCDGEPALGVGRGEAARPLAYWAWLEIFN